MKDHNIYMEHIFTCMNNISEYTANDKSNFISNKMAYDATLRKLQIMAKSTQRLLKELKAKITEIDWPRIAGFRNILVHDYMCELDSDKLWDVIQYQLPTLKQALLPHYTPPESQS